MTAPTSGQSGPLSPATATPAQLLFGDFEQEMAITRRVLERVPDGHAEWRPHEKSTSLGRLANHVAELPRLASSVAEAEEFDFAKTPYTPLALATTAEIVRQFDEETARMRARLEALTWQDVGTPWTLRAGDHVILSGPKGQVLRTLGLSHLAHHRAQLGVYLRLLGVAVPSVYGPSADEQG
ncbi:MAG TPA: DinB family protein [Gemmatirosa sp.]|nr:DinB family protein [Gemmatirosa sp.]